MNRIVLFAVAAVILVFGCSPSESTREAIESALAEYGYWIPDEASLPMLEQNDVRNGALSFMLEDDFNGNGKTDVVVSALNEEGAALVIFEKAEEGYTLIEAIPSRAALFLIPRLSSPSNGIWFGAESGTDNVAAVRWRKGRYEVLRPTITQMRIPRETKRLSAVSREGFETLIDEYFPRETIALLPDDEVPSRAQSDFSAIIYLARSYDGVRKTAVISAINESDPDVAYLFVVGYNEETFSARLEAGFEAVYRNTRLLLTQGAQGMVLAYDDIDFPDFSVALTYTDGNWKTTIALEN